MADVKSFLKKHWPLLVLAAITILAACVRVSIMRESFWIDELHTAWTINGTFREVFSRGKMGNQGPVYFVALWLWKHVAGMSEISLRLPSWIAGVALPATVYACWRKFDQSERLKYFAPLVAALCAATDPYAIFYSQEARPYAWVMLGSVIHFTVFALWLRRPSLRQAVLIVLGAAVLFFLHYTTALLFVAEAAYAIVVIATQSQADTNASRYFQVSLRQLLALPVAFAILCLPAVSTMKLLVERKNNWTFVGDPKLLDLPNLFPGAMGLVVVIVGNLVRIWRKDPKADNSTATRSVPIALRSEVWAGLWLFVPLCIAWLSTYWDVARLFFARYLVASLPGSWILMGQGSRAIDLNSRPWFVPAALLLIWWCVQPNFFESVSGRISRDEDWRAAIVFVNEHLPESPGKVYLDAGLIEEREWTGTKGQAENELREYLLLPVRGPYHLATEDVEPINDVAFAFSGRESGNCRWAIYRSRRVYGELIGRLIHKSAEPPFAHYKQFGGVSVMCLPPEKP